MRTKIRIETSANIICVGTNRIRQRGFVAQKERLIFGIWLHNVDQQLHLSLFLLGLDSRSLFELDTLFDCRRFHRTS